jgi:subtilisin family serine protease
LPEAWTFTTGAFPAGRPGLPWIAIVDSGIDITHPDLPVNTKVFVGPNRTTAAGTAARDQTGHGTRVAGIAGAVGNNGVAIAGASWSAVLAAIKVFEPNRRATQSALARGLQDGAALGRRVINYSGAGARTEAKASGVQFVNQADKVLVAAAGNQSRHDRRYPAGFSEKECFPNPPNPAQLRCYNTSTLSVGATDKNDRRADFGGGLGSNYGTWVKVYAPGICVLTTVRPGDVVAAAGDPCLPPPLLAPPAGANLDFVEGTSIAAPLVSGVAALMNAAKPSAGGALAFGQIPDLADNTGNNDPDGNRILRLNAFRAVRCAATNVCQ